VVGENILEVSLAVPTVVGENILEVVFSCPHGGRGKHFGVCGFYNIKMKNAFV